jgi:hypothetical protein
MSTGRLPDYGAPDPERWDEPPPCYRRRPPRTAWQVLAFVVISVLAVCGLVFIALIVFWVIALNNMGSNK